MADHYSLIGGAAGEIESGRVLLDGASYEIESGRVLVNGTSREIEFSRALQITMSGYMVATYAYVVVGNDTYTAGSTVEVEPDTRITVYVSAPNTTAAAKCLIEKDGATVKSGSGSYVFAAESNMTIVFSRGSVTVSGRLQPYYIATITTS